MTYATGSGSLETMLTSLAAFALANGWTPRTTSAHRYWSILGRTRDTTSAFTTEVDYIAMAESSGGANVLTGGTASATAGTPANALVDDGTPWTISLGGTRESRWTYDLGAGNEKNIVEVTLNFTTPGTSYEYFELQFSDDGSTWTALKGFRPGITATGQTFVGLWTNTNWPLSPDGDNYVMPTLVPDLSTTHNTLEGGTVPQTYSLLYWNIGRERLMPFSDQGATIELTTTTIDEWHFFGDDTSAVHFHAAFRTTFLGLPYWHHVSAGELDKKGMAHNGVAYCTTSLMTPIVKSGDTTPSSFNQHSTLDAAGYFVGGLVGSTSSLCYRLTQTGGAFPYPNDGNFPAHESTHVLGSRVMPTMLARIGGRRDSNQFVSSAGAPPALGSSGWRYVPHPTTGFVTLGALPFVVASSTDAATADLRWLGEFPNVRSVRLDNMEPGAEVTIGAETWKCFPLLRKLSAADATWPNRVAQSGPAGIAYKKVA